MKNSPLTTFLLAVLAVSAVLSVVFCWRYVSNTRELRALQGQVNAINNRNAGMASLMNDLVEYSKHNPAIEPILQSVNPNFKATPSSSTANKPPAK